MKTLKFVFAALIIAFLFTECKYDFIVPEEVPIIDPNDPDAEQISFGNQIMPIFTTNDCTSCHKTGGRAPDLTIGKAYAAINTIKYINTTTPEQSLIYTMPKPDGSHPKKYTASQAALLLAWIQQGAKNN